MKLLKRDKELTGLNLAIKMRKEKKFSTNSNSRLNHRRK